MNLFNIFQALVLGVIQGLTEFIPVSSSAHLEIIPSLLGWGKPNLNLILFAHAGTLLALIIYFRHDLWQYIKAVIAISRRQTKSKETKRDLLIVRNVLLASIPAGVIGIVFERYIDTFYDSGDYAGLAQMATLAAMASLGIVFIISQNWFHHKKREITHLPMWEAFVIGVSQPLAFIRGTSRSGITLITGQIFGLSRVEAAKFSFLMSIPLLLGTTVLSIVQLSGMDDITSQLPAVITIFVSAFVSGWFAVKYLLEYLKKNSLASFGWYRIVFAIIAALLLFS